MQGKVDEQQSNDIEAEFGYYPVEVNVETDDFSLLTLPGLAEKTNLINNHRNVINGWIYQETKKYITSMEAYPQCLLANEYLAYPKHTH